MADNSGDFMRSMGIATSGLRAQAGRMRIISENIANADSTAQTAGGDPYRRKVPTFSSALDRALDAKVVTLGRVGYIAKGVALGIVGVLFMLAAWHADESEATGLDGAMRTLKEGPAGTLLLSLVALGFIAFGVYCVVRTRYGKL